MSPSLSPQGVEPTLNRSSTQNIESSSTPITQDPSHVDAPPKPARVLGPDLLRGLLMLLMSLDHCSLGLGAWQHGAGLVSEQDGANVLHWNTPLAWTVRMVTHLCAPGFFLLLGMGIVYFGRSRTKLGWSRWRMIKHFLLRVVALLVANQIAFGWLVPGIWIFNAVMVALALNYGLMGIGWIGMEAAEKALGRMVEKKRSEEQEPLLLSSSEMSTSSLPQYLIDGLLLVLVGITIFWNSWFSLDHGTCSSPIDLPPQPLATGNVWFDFWFYSVNTKRIMSGFPPLAWTSFAILGVLYGRILSRRKWSQTTLLLGHLSTSFILLILFISTRLFHYGNLSENCLSHLPEQISHPNRNQYLTSFQSFLYVTKYPPSFAFFTYTLSVNFLLLALLNIVPPALATSFPILLDLGTSAFFFYILHIPFYFVLGIPVKKVFGTEMPWTDPVTHMPTIGVKSRLLFWAVWVMGIAILWPACRWYGRFKMSKGPDSVFRLF